MSDTDFSARYTIETPLSVHKIANLMAGEQSSGTFTRVPGETDELRARAQALVVDIKDLGPVEPSLHSAWLERRGISGPSNRAEVTISFPIANVGNNLSTLVSIVTGNLFDLGETTGLRLDSVTLPDDYRRQFAMPTQGVAGTRRAAGVAKGPLIGSIIKPNVGLTPKDTAAVVAQLCEAGVDFIKDDEINANSLHAPLTERVKAVMEVIRRHAERTGKKVVMAFNITDETDAMRRHADLVRTEGGDCVMASLNWCGFSAMETLRRSTDLAIHGHRNGFGAFSRHPALGFGFSAYQTLWRLTGVDHMHVHGLSGKFAQEDSEVIEGARESLTPLGSMDDRVMPVFSSAQWAGTAHQTHAALGSADLLFMAGGGIMAHPGGPGDGVRSIRHAWDAALAGISLAEAQKTSKPLQQAVEFFGAGQ